ncbi:protein of unknown function [Microbacterium sp. Nx66]|nr:protein of unknown function [Microbacterium sp. Nx66]
MTRSGRSSPWAPERAGETARLNPQSKTGRTTDAGEPRRMQPGTEGASLPANLSGTRTAEVRPL